MVGISDFAIGQTVEVHDGKHAVVRFIGKTEFAPGDWLGVELEDDSGKNDGSVQGQRYFNCASGHGMFCRPAAVSVIEQIKPAASKRSSIAAAGAVAKSRPTSTAGTAGQAKRQSILDPTSKRKSINTVSPTPPGKASANNRLIRSPTKSPTKQLTSKTTSIAANKAALSNSTKSSLSTTKRTSLMGRPSLAASSTSTSSRQSLSGTAVTSHRLSLSSRKPTAGRPATIQRPTRPGSTNGLVPSGHSSKTPPDDDSKNSLESPEDEQNGGCRTFSSLESEPLSSPTSKRTPAGEGQGRAPLSSLRSTVPSVALTRELEDLRTRIKVTEKKRLEDREKLKNLEKIQGDRDKFEGIIQKLQSKMQLQQQEVTELRKNLKESEAVAEVVRNQRLDFDLAMESAFVDKEMAEERYEVCKNELDMLYEKYEELQLEVEVLREENSELGKEMSPEERTSQGWLQLERSNARLREALLRLRDMTQEQEAELKDQIRELQEDNSKLSDSVQSHDQTNAKLQSSEQLVEELKQRLDSALGSEEMIEELTEKNMSLTEKNDEYRAVIEDLENLKELNDELELNHIENEKQLQDELDYQEALLVDQIRKYNTQEETVADLEYTISRFRELVGNLQGDLEDLRASQQITEHEATELNSRSKAMMDLNLRLQASASKAQNKAVEMELGKLDAQQASDHLSIVQCFLPDSYTIDKDSVNAYLRIKRIGFKASLLHGHVKERANGIATPGQEDDIFAACVVLDDLTWVSCMCRRFTQFINSCSLGSFKKIEGALYDLDPVERALNGWVENLKRGELRESQCASELKRSIAVLSHLAEVHIAEGPQLYADDVHMRATMIQSRLENIAVAIFQIKQISQARIVLPTDADEEDEAIAERFLSKADSLVTQLRSTKVIAGKAAAQLEELRSRSLTLDPSTEPSIEQIEKALDDMVNSCQSSAMALLKLVNDEDQNFSLTYDDISQAISPNDSFVFGRSASQSQAVASQIQNFHTLTTTLSQTVEFTVPSSQAPWEALSQNLRAEASTYALHEKEVLRLKDELTEKNTAVAIKDKAIEELNVNIEVLSRRVNESSGRKEKLKELEINIEASRAKEQETASRLTSLQREYEALEADRESLAKQATQAGAKAVDGGVAIEGAPVQVVSAVSKAEQEVLECKLKRINSSLRQLRQSLHRPPASASKLQLLEPVILTRGEASVGVTDSGADLKRSRPSWQETGLAAEAAYESLSQIMVSTDFKGILLSPVEREKRLAWRPSHEAPRWVAEQQKLQLGLWREICSAACKIKKPACSLQRTVEMNRECIRRKKEFPVNIQAGPQPKEQMPSHFLGIAPPEGWDDFERRLVV